MLKFCQLDLAQAESKLVAHLCIPWGKNYLSACRSSDLHTVVTKMVWPELFDRANLPDREVANRKFYRDYTYRDMAKRGGHGSNYGGSPAILAQHLKVPIAVAEAFQRKYFSAFPEIRDWQNNIKVRLAQGEPITTPLGRRCHFPGRSWDNDTIKSAIAYTPQSTIGDALNLGFYNVWKKYDRIWGKEKPIEILMQIHDAIIFQYRHTDESWLIPEIVNALQYPIEINGETCIIGVDPQVGWNAGKQKKYRDEQGNVTYDNFFGLADYNGSDDRSAPSRAPLLDRVLYDSYTPSK